MLFEKEVFEDKQIQLDGNQYIGCTFRRCELKFSANASVDLQYCSFEKCKWTFIEAAALTVQFMTALYHGAGEGGKNLIEQTFKNIQRGRQH